MKKVFLALFLSSIFLGNVLCQTLEEKKGVRLHEHHTNDPVPIGGKSGYDLMDHQYIRIFSSDGGPAPVEDRAKIDVHEAFDINTASTESSNFGFTSEEETGEFPYGGNNITTFVVAPAGFNYDVVTTMDQIKDSFNAAGTPVKTIKPVVVGSVYLAKLRNLEHYVAIKVIDGVLGGRNAIDEVFFDFDYKYPSTTLSVRDYELDKNVRIYPNPIENKRVSLKVSNDQKIRQIKIFNVLGRLIFSNKYKEKPEMIDLSNYSSGLYLVKIESDKGYTSKKIILK